MILSLVLHLTDKTKTKKSTKELMETKTTTKHFSPENIFPISCFFSFECKLEKLLSI